MYISGVLAQESRTNSGLSLGRTLCYIFAMMQLTWFLMSVAASQLQEDDALLQASRLAQHNTEEDGAVKPILSGAGLPAPAQSGGYFLSSSKKTCSTGVPITKDECLAAGAAVAAANHQTQGSEQLDSHNWDTNVAGCSLYTGGDWSTKWNTESNPSGPFNDRFTPVCWKPTPATSGGYLLSSSKKTCTTGVPVTTKDECIAAGAAVAAANHQAQGRTHLMSASWNTIVSGCSLQTGGDWATHFNTRRHPSIQEGTYTVVCWTPAPPSYQLATEQGCPLGHTRLVDEDICKASLHIEGVDHPFSPNGPDGGCWPDWYLHHYTGVCLPLMKMPHH